MTDYLLEIIDPERGLATAIGEHLDPRIHELIDSDSVHNNLVEWSLSVADENVHKASQAIQKWIEQPTGNAKLDCAVAEGVPARIRLTLGSTPLSVAEKLAALRTAALIMRSRPTAYAAEGLIGGIIRYLCSENRHDDAALSVKEYLKFGPTTYVMMLSFAIDMKLHGDPLPPYLEQLLGAQGNYFAGKFCERPFGELEIAPNGDTFICCPSHLPKPIGNIQHSDADGIINSAAAKRIRRSILNSSFHFCDWTKCNIIKTGILPDRSKLGAGRIRQLEALNGEIASPRAVRLSYDSTCNLSCPSCRTEKLVAKGVDFDRIMRVTNEVITPLLKNAEIVMMNGYGDIFSSRSCRRILEMVSPATHPKLKLLFITNGVLLTENEWAKFPNIHTMVDSVRVSIDAARAETYEKVRVGGDFDKLSRNLEFLSQLHDAGTIREFMISFVVQRDNFREMDEFYSWGRALGCDWIIYEVLQDWNTFGDRYGERAVHLPDNPLNAEFRQHASHIETLRREVFHKPRGRITCDFGFKLFQ